MESIPAFDWRRVNRCSNDSHLYYLPDYADPEIDIVQEDPVLDSLIADVDNLTVDPEVQQVEFWSGEEFKTNEVQVEDIEM